MEKKRSTVLDYNATVDKILKGDIPDVSSNRQDYIIHVSDSVGTIYANIMAKLIIGSVDDSMDDEMVANRVELYDSIMGVVSQCQFGRLMNMVDGLNSIVSEQMNRTDVFSSNRIRNIILGFAVDWWLYNVEQRNSVLVTETVDDEGDPVDEANEVVEASEVVEADKVSE